MGLMRRDGCRWRVQRVLVAMILTLADADYWHYMEIGTSNFRTLVGHQPPEQRGLSIEAMPFYIKELRDRYASTHPNAKLINVAVLPSTSNASVVQAFYIHPDNITSMNLPSHLLGMSRMGAPHPSMKNFRDALHLLRSRPVRATSLERLLDQHKVCRLGLLKLDVEGCDHALMSDYVTYMRQHPSCWSDAVEFEVHPAFMTKVQTRELLDSLQSLGYTSGGGKVKKALLADGLSGAYSIRLVHRIYFDGRFARHQRSPLSWSATDVPKTVHMLLPCFFRSTDKIKCHNDNSTRQRLLWYQAAGAWPKGWQLKIWSPKALTAALASEPEDWPALLHLNPDFREHRVSYMTAKYHILAYFGGIFVDWHLKPSGQRGALTQLMAAIDRAKERHGFWCLDPGPGRLRSIAGAVVLGAAFHPVLQHMGIEIKMQAMERNDAQISMSKTELYILNQYYREWSGEDLTCERANFTVNRHHVVT